MSNNDEFDFLEELAADADDYEVEKFDDDDDDEGCGGACKL